MRESLGRRLRRERERRSISLASIAAETKISAALLEALECDDISHWPPGIFRRSFVRAYANAIGVDAEAVVEEFQEWFPDEGGAEPSKKRAVEHLLPLIPLRLTLADEGSRLAGSRLLSQMRRSWKGVAWDLATLLAIGAGSFVVFGEFWMALAVASLGYYAGAVLLLGITPGVMFFKPKVFSREPGHLRLLVGNTASADDESQALAREDERLGLALRLETGKDPAEPTRRAVG